MIKNYFKIAWRNLIKHKLFSGIHIAGLAIAFASALILYLTVDFEYSFDNFHHNSGDIYQTYFEEDRGNGRQQDAAMPFPLAEAASAEIPSIKRITRFANSNLNYRQGDKQLSINTKFVDMDFFDMFSFRLLEGNPSAMGEEGSVILTKKTAIGLFGDEHAIGRTIEIKRGEEWKLSNVVAVMDDIPENSSIRASAFIHFTDNSRYQALKNDWSNFNHSVFVQLHPGTKKTTFERQAKPFVEKYLAEDIHALKRDGAKLDEYGGYLSLRLLPFQELHFSQVGIGSGTSTLYLHLLLLIAFLILFIASANFVNLSLASSFNRSREIGMRKTLGAWTYQLIGQIWGEAFFVCILSLLLGLAFAHLFLPYYNAALNYQLDLVQLLSWQNILVLSLVFLVVTGIAGGYPATIMAKFNTLAILKGKLKISAGSHLQKVFVVGQFAIAATFITVTLIVGKQINYLQDRPLGYDKDEIISIPIGSEVNPAQAVQQMRHKLAARPEVLSVSASYINMGLGDDGTSIVSTSGVTVDGKEVYTHKRRVDYDYVQTMGMTVVAGRDFSTASSSDTLGIIINEKLATQLGGNDLIGKRFPLYDDDMHIIGIVKDFNFADLREAVEPMVLHMNNAQSLRYIFVKVSPQNLQTAMKAVETAWQEVNPVAMAAPSFVDENTGRQYEREQRLSHTVVAGAILSITISCMGLFALTLLVMNQRKKEITIRKVLGARMDTLIRMLSQDFLKLVVLAFLIACPVSWWLMNNWLDDFAYRITLDVSVFLYGAVLILLLAGITIGIQAWKVALVNPVDNLRDE